MCDVAPVHPDIEATAKGLTTAIRACGAWPVSGELADFVIAAQRAEDEINRSLTTWHRWTRRFNPTSDVLKLGSTRTNTRYELSRALLALRSDVLRQLLGPPAGSA
jgi:hypothetical protein